MIISIIAGIILVFFFWLLFDFSHGRKKHLSNVKKRSYPVRHGDLKLFTNGHDLYASLFKGIKTAKHHIHVLFYIIKNDDISHDFLRLLMDKARQGVTVRLLLDRVGGHKLSKKTIRQLKNAGVHFQFCNRPHFPFFFYLLNYRNHRKITIIDGEIGYVGGFNIGKEYLGLEPKLGFWRDFHLKVLGEGVQDLQTEFLRDWSTANKENSLETQDDLYPPLEGGGVEMQFFPTDGAYMKEFILNLIKLATCEIKIGTPYFIPGHDIEKALIKAAKKGITVKILVPMKADHPFVKEASFPYFENLLKAGCDIYRFNEGFYHGKLVIIDNKLCDIGTANFDKRSLFINDEINCIVQADSFVKIINEQFNNDILMAKKLTLNDLNKRSIFQRGKESFSTLISDLL